MERKADKQYSVLSEKELMDLPRARYPAFQREGSSLAAKAYFFLRSHSEERVFWEVRGVQRGLREYGDFSQPSHRSSFWKWVNRAKNTDMLVDHGLQPERHIIPGKRDAFRNAYAQRLPYAAVSTMMLVFLLLAWAANLDSPANRKDAATMLHCLVHAAGPRFTIELHSSCVLVQDGLVDKRAISEAVLRCSGRRAQVDFDRRVSHGRAELGSCLRGLFVAKVTSLTSQIAFSLSAAVDAWAYTWPSDPLRDGFVYPGHGADADMVQAQAVDTVFF